MRYGGRITVDLPEGTEYKAIHEKIDEWVEIGAGKEYEIGHREPQKLILTKSWMDRFCLAIFVSFGIIPLLYQIYLTAPALALGYWPRVFRTIAWGFFGVVGIATLISIFQSKITITIYLGKSRANIYIDSNKKIEAEQDLDSLLKQVFTEKLEQSRGSRLPISSGEKTGRKRSIIFSEDFGRKEIHNRIEKWEQTDTGSQYEIQKRTPQEVVLGKASTDSRIKAIVALSFLSLQFSLIQPLFIGMAVRLWWIEAEITLILIFVIAGILWMKFLRPIVTISIHLGEERVDLEIESNREEMGYQADFDLLNDVMEDTSLLSN